MTPVQYFQALSVTLAWNVARGYGLAAMVNVLHAIRNRAEKFGSYSSVLAAEMSELDSKFGICDVRSSDFRKLLEIAPQIIRELKLIEPNTYEPCQRRSDIGKATEWSTNPKIGGMNIGGLYFYGGLDKSLDNISELK